MRKLLLIICSLLVFAISSAQTISTRDKEYVRRFFVSSCKELNEQLPIDIDELTRLESFVFYNWQVTANYKVIDDAEAYSDEEISDIKKEMRERFKVTASKMFQNGAYAVSKYDLKSLMKVTGLKFRATYRDLFGNYFFSVVLDYRDF